jgi:hypothetical protein
MARKKKSGIGIMRDLMQATKCSSCGTREGTVSYDRRTRTGSIKRDTRCLACK